MKRYCITFRSITPAQRAQQILQREGIFTDLRRTPRRLTQRSCGYCLYLRGTELEKALAALEKMKMDFQSVYDAEKSEEVES